ncbi:hypothetical protein DB30_07796 [Enhygromyxa salina]|uniref:Uncharacterized protein n=1 Tax=Enhygromyxa salina TaxID=215803 RepID=A0A0C2D6J0_9BACT|nr:hypothetical protein [Enhygromyxa salina]KIG18781.1 hypothetical protein DB30_07796 [Enhygromyxa salina]
MRMRTNSPEQRSNQTRQRLQSAKSQVHVGVMTRHALHNVVALALATAGIVLLTIGLLDWLEHPLTLWMNLP